MKKFASTLCFNADGKEITPPEVETFMPFVHGMADAKGMFSSDGPQDHVEKRASVNERQKYASVALSLGKSNPQLADALKKFAAAKANSTRLYWCKQAAEYMGNTNDMELETAIFTLSSHFIKEKASKLFDLNYFVGFRILDKSDDNTKVVGIYGFKIGKAWVYIPIFFDNGKINGFELCYIQNKDQFVPLKEGWIDWVIKNSGDNMFGKADSKDFRSLGIRYPDMKQLTQPPVLGKVASFEPWVQVGLLGLVKHAAQQDTEKSPFDFEKLASTDARLFAHLASACDKYPLYKVAVESVYGADFLQRTGDRILNSYAKIAKAKTAFKITPRHAKNAAVTVVTQDDKAAFPFLSEKQAEELLGGPIAIDGREDDEVAVVEDEMQFVSPSGTGVYDILFADGSIRECLVIVGPLFRDKKDEKEECLVIDWKRKQHIFAKAMAVLCVKGSAKENWFNRLPADQFRSGTSMRDSEAKRCRDRVIIMPDGTGTIPLFALNANGVWTTFSRGANRDYTYGNDNGRLETIPQYLVCSPTFAGNRAVIRDDKLILPSKFKYIDLSDGEYDESTSMALATENDIIKLMYSGRKKLKVIKTASKYIINRNELNKEAAFKHLVLDYGFRAKIANEILDAAELVSGQTISIPYSEPLHKIAELPMSQNGGGGGFLSEMADNTMSPIFNPNPMETDSYSGLPMEGGLSESQQLGFEDQPVPPEWLNEVPPPDPMALQAATEAAQTGRKDIFDVESLVAMLNTNRRDDSLQDYSKVLKKSLDTVCRILFKLFWDREGFIDRFGDENIQKFEDTLKDTLDVLGDLVLFLLSKDDRPELGDFLDNIGTEDE